MLAGKFDIAVGKSRSAKKWKAHSFTWEEIREKLQTPVITSETVEEYKRMRKAQRDEVKDVGGFVAGRLRDDTRKNENVISRSMITLDIDKADPDLIDTIEMLCDYTAILYSTHSHTPESPRLRMVLPLTRDVTPDEYVAVAKYIADEWGMSMFDECSFRPAQLMYWPSRSIDGEYVFKSYRGEVLNPDKILQKHPNWRDLKDAPKSRTETEPARVADPTTKPGVIGAFCRVYTITQAIATFLGGIYAPTSIENRFDYVPADSMAGVVVYEDKWAYSHHASDPAFGMELNAFDLVRVHKFGNEDEEKSLHDMQEYALSLPDVKRKLIVMNNAEAARDFDDGFYDWVGDLQVDKKGAFKNCPENFLTIMRKDPALQGICYNKMRSTLSKKAAVPWSDVKEDWCDPDLDQLWAYLVGKYGLGGKENMLSALGAAAAERAYHPIIDYFNSLPEWDGIERAESLMIDYLGADDNAYVREATLKTLQAAVERIYKPGIKFDTALILNGPQGIGKSMIFAKLAHDEKWFSDSLTLGDMRDKTAPEKLQGFWIMEIAELVGMRKAEIESVKAFMTRVDDQYRASFGRVVESHRRQSIIVGTTNAESGFLRDTTGNRRFWVIEVTGEGRKKPWELTEYDVNMVWAEILEMRRQCGVADLRLSREAAALALNAQENAMEQDDRLPVVEEYLNMLLPEDWDTRSAADKRRYVQDYSGIGEVGKVTRDKVSIIEIWCECFGNDASRLQRTDSLAISAMLKQLGWIKQNKVSRFKGYNHTGNYYIRKNM